MLALLVGNVMIDTLVRLLPKAENGEWRMERGCQGGIQEETTYLGAPFTSTGSVQATELRTSPA